MTLVKYIEKKIIVYKYASYHICSYTMKNSIEVYVKEILEIIITTKRLY